MFQVRKRHCARWNEDIGLHGGWDTDSVKTIYADDSVASCYSTRLGTFAVVAEIEDDPYATDDADWLLIFKMVGHGLSIICLLIFIGVILSSTYLWEMFHTLGLHVAIALLFGHVSMLVTELDAVRDLRPACAALGALISFFYTTAATMLALEAFAVFRAITGGVIGGHTMMYLCYGYGSGFLGLGINIFKHLALMGDDPRCMVGWDNAPKWTFFCPVLAMAAVSLWQKIRTSHSTISE